MDKNLALAGVLTLMAGPAAAFGYECLYVSECYETDACQETAFQLSVDVAEDYASATLGAVSGEVQAVAYNAQGLSYYAGYANSSMHVVSVFLNGQSRYSFQTGTDDELLVVTYHGTCTQI